ncbi:MAG: hypothetical protein ACRDGI_09195 [Candidatus Limnocylindrales bacterium]
MTYLRRFGAFLYDFLVGDAWELFVGPILALLAAWLLIQAGLSTALVGLILFGFVLAIAIVHLSVALRGSA